MPHGAPDELSQSAWADGVDEDIASSSLQLPSLAGRTVISTFGLISASKGLEVAIRALPAITAAHPEVLYLVAGQTHPDVIHGRGRATGSDWPVSYVILVSTSMCASSTGS